MKISGIIAEYNPFHNGHAYHIKKTREAGAEAVVVVLGGNFTQRGDVSIMPKLLKAKAAIECGADLVIEMPCVYALGAAKDFATGGVKLLNALGCIDALSFGCEAKNLEQLTNTAEAISKLEQEQKLKGIMAQGTGFAGARETMLNESGFQKEASIIKEPNNILAIEYLLALKATNSMIRPFCTERICAAHDEQILDPPIAYEGGICSASQLRKIIGKDVKQASSFMPPPAFNLLSEAIARGRAPIFLYQLEQAILSRLRMFSSADIKNINGVSEGLENRIVYAIRNSASLEDLIACASSKRYTSARIRRILLSSCLGITRRLISSDPPYIRVLASNQKGFEILKTAKPKTTLPVVTRAGLLSSLGQTAAAFSLIEGAAADLYSLAFNPPGKCGLEFTETNFL